MDKKKAVLISGAALLAAAGLACYAVAPGRTDESMRARFAGRNYAHRGLYDNQSAAPENSMPAFEAAARVGYGIELDVQLSHDGQVVVFHDDNLMRVCGVDARVCDYTYRGLRELRLCGSRERIPLFTDVLETVAGRVPLIVELKSGDANDELCRKTTDILRSYKGDYCVESFDPFIVRWFRRNEPDIVRGQLAMPTGCYDPRLPKTLALLMAFTLGNFRTRPHFIAYKVGHKPLTVRIAERLGALSVCWTSHDKANERNNDIVIFEHYRPRTRIS